MTARPRPAANPDACPDGRLDRPGAAEPVLSISPTRHVTNIAAVSCGPCDVPNQSVAVVIIDQLCEIMQRAEQVAGRLEAAASTCREDADKCTGASRALHERLQLGAQMLTALDVACERARAVPVTDQSVHDAGDAERLERDRQQHTRLADEVRAMRADVEAAVERARRLRHEAEDTWADIAHRAANAAKALQRDLSGNLTSVANRLLELARDVRANGAMHTSTEAAPGRDRSDGPILRLHRPAHDSVESAAKHIDAG